MFLSSEQIKKEVESGGLAISPFAEENLKPASYNFTLDDSLKDTLSGKEVIIPPEGYKLVPGAFILGRTKESVKLNNKFICILSTRKSFAQQGVDVLQSSAIAEPDTNGKFTLEITNRGLQEVVLLPGTRVVKGIFGAVQNQPVPNASNRS